MFFCFGNDEGGSGYKFGGDDGFPGNPVLRAAQPLSNKGNGDGGYETRSNRTLT